MTTADFNQRAQQACRKIGFNPAQRFGRIPDGEPFTVFTIKLELA